MIDAASYDALGTLAAFSAAISIAYAGLPNFRHRADIQQYVDDSVKKDSVAEVVSTKPDLINHECWCVLYRLGNIKDKKLRPTTDGDRNFQRTSEFKLFSWLYGTNLDKQITIGLGSLCASAIWFGLVDRTNFPVPKEQDFYREWLLTTFIGFYALFILLGLLSVVLHSAIFSKDIRPDRWFYKIPHWTNCGIVGLFIFFIALTDFGFHPLGDFGRVVMLISTQAPLSIPIETVAFALTRSLLLTAAITPLYLLWRGNQLAKSMRTEVDRCVGTLGGKVQRAAEEAVIDPAP